jgi:protein-arginine deiminase
MVHELFPYNDYLQAEIDWTRWQLTYELGLDDPEDIVEVPVLFRLNAQYTRAEALTPNMVNLLTVSSYHPVIPMPFGPVDDGLDQFVSYMFDPLLWLGLTLHFIDDWVWYHNLYGEVHCGTNACRFPSTTDHWWEQE